jgi:CHASE2 domain-containing sensor protein
MIASLANSDLSECEIARASDRAVLRILDPYPTNIVRGSPRTIPFEALLDEEHLPEDVRDKTVLLGVELPGVDEIDCGGAIAKCSKVWGVSLHAATFDTLFRDRPIRPIHPAVQLVWMALACAAVGAWRLATPSRSAWRRNAGLLVAMVASASVAVALTMNYGLIVDVLHHLLAMLATYLLVARIEPARRKFTRYET